MHDCIMIKSYLVGENMYQVTIIFAGNLSVKVRNLMEQFPEKTTAEEVTFT